MSSQDNFKGRKDEALRKELGLSDQERPKETATTASTGVAKRVRQMAPQILRLASRLRVDPDELAARLPDDTVRRLKYPVLEVENEDGSRSFKHDHGIVEGRRASIRS